MNENITRSAEKSRKRTNQMRKFKNPIPKRK
jgi:hypothetical protein